MSSTSGSCVSSVGAGEPRRLAEVVRARWCGRRACTRRGSGAPTRAGARSPGVDVLHPVLPGLPQLSGTSSTAAPRAPPRGPARPSRSMLQNHCVETSGSIGSPPRWLWPTLCSWSSTLTRAPRLAQPLDHPRSRASKRSSPAKLSPAAAVIRPSACDHLDRPAGRGAGRVSKSFGSWNGVTFTTPVPNSGSTAVVGDDRQLAADDRQHGRAADEVPVALVLRMHGDRGVAEHRLGTRRRDHQPVAPVAARRRVGDVVELALDGPRLDLEVGDRGVQRRRPVDHVLAAIDQPLVVEPHEGVAHRAREAGVEREALARPVAAGAEQLELAGGCCRGTAPSTPRCARGTARGRARWRLVPSFASSRSTIIWVAMPAWSVPGSQSVL